jgi:hypothetical protein
MDELIRQLTAKVGLSAEQSQQVLGIVMQFMKDKLPADVMNQISSAVPDLGNMLGDVAGAASGAAGAASGAAGDAASGAAGGAKDAAGSASSTAGGVMDSIKGMFKS